jgi:ATP-dependent Lhr-like helicase
MVCDEWHELLGTKRGVQVELGLSRLKGLGAEILRCGERILKLLPLWQLHTTPLRIWGISHHRQPGTGR